MVECASSNPKISFLLDSTVEDVLGETSVESVRVKDCKTGEKRDLRVDGSFAAIGHQPATGLFKGQVAMDGAGYVLQKEHTVTSVRGVFAAGDVSDTRCRQSVTAAGGDRRREVAGGTG